MPKFKRHLALGAILATVGAGLAAASAGAAITPEPNTVPGATALGQSILAVPAQLTTAQFDAVSNAQPSEVSGHTSDPDNGPTALGTSALTGFPTAGADFGILTTGDPFLADQSNDFPDSGRENDGSDNVRGDTDLDTTILRLSVTVPNGANCLALDYRFLSDEFPEFVGSSFNDAFIAEVDTSNWSDSGTTISAPNDFATKTGNSGVSVNGVGPVAVFPAESTGTTYDAATGLVTTKTTITPGAHSIYLSIFDQQDHAYDSAVFVDNLRFITEDASTCKPPEVAQAPPPPPATPPPPSNDIQGSSIKFKNGATILSVNVPGPGTVAASQATGAAASRLADAAKKKKHKKPVLIKKATVTATGPGIVKLTIKPTAAGRKLLKKKGKFTVNTAITFTPTGGTAKTTFKKVTIKLLRKHHKKH